MISRRHFLKLFGGLGALGVSTTAYGLSEPALQLRVTRYNLTPPQWPADFKLKIAVITDLHACDPWMSLDRIQGIVERTNALKADVIVMLGDYVAGHRKVTRFIPASEWAQVLAGLKAPLGVHAILGNHDWWEDKEVQREGNGHTVARRALEASGIPVYENDARRLTKDGRPSGWQGSAISSPIFRRAASGRYGASVLTISVRRWQKSPMTHRLFCWRMSLTSPGACRRGWRCSSPATPMAVRCACSAGRR